MLSELSMSGEIYLAGGLPGCIIMVSSMPIASAFPGVMMAASPRVRLPFTQFIHGGLLPAVLPVAQALFHERAAVLELPRALPVLHR